MGALIERHGGAVHTLDQNVRQHNVAEREALAELRAGDVARAVEFYLDQDRVATADPRRGAGQDGDQWAGRVRAGTPPCSPGAGPTWRS